MPLAELSADAGLVGILRKPCRSLIKPAEQFGKQISGGAGCLASFGNSGISGAATTTGSCGKVGDTPAQPVSSSASSAGIGLSSLAGDLFGITCLLHGLAACSSEFGTLYSRLIDRRQLAGMLGQQLGAQGLSPRGRSLQAQGLRPKRGRQDEDGSQRQPGASGDEREQLNHEKASSARS